LKDVILIHNHPSVRVGLFKRACSEKPSSEDIEITRILKNQLSKYGFNLRDHIIVSQNKKFFSFARNKFI
jgi:DNA repair protein RadC